MTYILTIILFSGSVTHMSFSDVNACESAMYDRIDQVMPKNVRHAECKRVG